MSTMPPTALILLLILAGCSSGGGPGGKPQPPPVTPPPPNPEHCSYTLMWTNPVEDVNGEPLEPSELVAATAYFFRIPNSPEAVALSVGEIPPYVLQFTHIMSWEENNGIQYFINLTVSNLDADGNPQESELSNQVTKVCE